MNSNTGADEQVVIRKRERTLINLINICTEAGGKLLKGVLALFTESSGCSHECDY